MEGNEMLVVDAEEADTTTTSKLSSGKKQSDVP
jgi:hypothetical protein